jgi:hypothetical protein
MGARTRADSKPQALIELKTDIARVLAARRATGAAVRAVITRLCPAARRGIVHPPLPALCQALVAISKRDPAASFNRYIRIDAVHSPGRNKLPAN